MIQFNPDDPFTNNPTTEMMLAPGDIVEHIRYGYRGLVVAANLTCQADDQWYQTNITQPPKNQPWYHVLVDNSENVTYAAQTNLTRSNSEDPINHALIKVFFEAFVPNEHRYIRNDTPWEH